MRRHILVVDSPRSWYIVHPPGMTSDRGVCERLQFAADVFMNPPALPEPEEKSWRMELLWVLATVVDLVRGRRLEVDPGAYWCAVADDGNFEIGGRLPTAQAFVYAGRM